MHKTENFPSNSDKTGAEIYKQGQRLFEQKKYKAAIKNFNEIEVLYPFSNWAKEAQFMSASISYQIGDYSTAAYHFDNYIQTYPNSENIVYAYYIRAMSYYMQIKDINLSQTIAMKAQDLFNEFIAIFPSSEYVPKIKDKILLLRQHLAAKEFLIGKSYFNTGKYIAAIKRFNVIVREYKETEYLPEALFRMYECYSALGAEVEGQKYLVMLQNFPDSIWYKHSLPVVQTVDKK